MSTTERDMLWDDIVNATFLEVLTSKEIAVALAPPVPYARLGAHGPDRTHRGLSDQPRASYRAKTVRERHSSPRIAQ